MQVKLHTPRVPIGYHPSASSLLALWKQKKSDIKREDISYTKNKVDKKSEDILCTKIKADKKSEDISCNKN